MKTTLNSRKILHQCYQLSSPILPTSKALYVTGSRRCTTPLSNLMSFSCRALLFSRNLPFSQNSEPHKQKGPHKVLLNGISSHLVDSLHWGTLQGRDSIKEKKQQMLAKTWKYARLLNTEERTKICNSPKSPRKKKLAWERYSPTDWIWKNSMLERKQKRETERG